MKELDRSKRILTRKLGNRPQKPDEKRCLEAILLSFLKKRKRERRKRKKERKKKPVKQWEEERGLFF